MADVDSSEELSHSVRLTTIGSDSSTEDESQEEDSLSVSLQPDSKAAATASTRGFYTRWYFRYIMLIFVCNIKFFQNFLYDIPSGMEDIIIKTVGIDITRYTLLFSVYSWPNTVLPVIGGIIVDRVVGLRVGVMFFMCVSTIGQLGFSLSGYFNSYPLMVVSRFVIGVGSQMSLTVTDAFISRWFKGKEMALMFSIIVVATRSGGIAGIYLNSIIYDWFAAVENKHSRLGLTLMVSFFIMVVSTAMTIILVVLDKKGEKSRKMADTNKFSINNEAADLPQTKKTFKAKCLEWIKTFNIYFWLVCVMYPMYYATVFPFITTSQLFFKSKFKLSNKQANAGAIVSYTIPLLGPVIGLLMDRTGGYVSWGVFGGLCVLFGGHLLFAFSANQFYIPFIGNIIVGLSYIGFTSMRAVPAILVNYDERYLATAFGLAEVFESIGYSVNDVILGALVDHHGYFAQEIYLLCFISIGILAGIFVLPSKANACKLRKKSKS